MKLLSPRQRLLLTRLALKAHKLRVNAHSTDQTFDEYRHAESIAACGHTISEAPRACFDDLYTHFLAEAGETAKAFDHAMQPQSNDWRTWQLKILDELKKDNLPWSYAQKISVKKWGKSLEDLSPPQIQAIFYDTRRAVSNRLKKATA